VTDHPTPEPDPTPTWVQPASESADATSAVPIAGPPVPMYSPTIDPQIVEGRKHSTRNRSLLIGAVTVALLATVGGVAWAVAPHGVRSSSTQGFGNGDQQGFGRGGSGFPGGREGGRMGMFALAGALHGDFVIQQNSGYVTERLQRGSISAVSSTSLTVKSVDGYSSTYTVSAQTRVPNGNLKSGDTVEVLATVSGSQATATLVTTGVMGGPGQGGRNGDDNQPGPAQSGQAQLGQAQAAT
jgi:hypothetical protein